MESKGPDAQDAHAQDDLHLRILSMFKDFCFLLTQLIYLWRTVQGNYSIVIIESRQAKMWLRDMRTTKAQISMQFDDALRWLLTKSLETAVRNNGKQKSQLDRYFGFGKRPVQKIVVKYHFDGDIYSCDYNRKPICSVRLSHIPCLQGLDTAGVLSAFLYKIDIFCDFCVCFNADQTLWV